MSLINRQWAIFEIGLLFETKRGSFKGLGKKGSSEGTKVISANTNYNGFVGFTDRKPEYEGNVFTIANTGQGSVGTVFYQDEPFIPTNNITVLIPKFTLNRYIALFLLPFFKKERYRLSFGRILNESRLNKHTIKLPVDRNVNPDWTFMDEYAANLINRISVQGTITQEPYHQAKVNLSDRKWLLFRYDDERLFSIERGIGARKEDVAKDGNTPLITAIGMNNGLIGFVNKAPKHNANVIAVVRNGENVAEAYYQLIPFCSTEDVHIFNPKFPLNQYVAMFLISLIRKERFRFNYARKWGIERMNETEMMLPVDNHGNPDWKFMEDYIKSLPYSKNL